MQCLIFHSSVSGRYMWAVGEDTCGRCVQIHVSDETKHYFATFKVLRGEEVVKLAGVANLLMEVLFQLD